MGCFLCGWMCCMVGCVCLMGFSACGMCCVLWDVLFGGKSCLVGCFVWLDALFGWMLCSAGCFVWWGSFLLVRCVSSVAESENDV